MAGSEIMNILVADNPETDKAEFHVVIKNAMMSKSNDICVRWAYLSNVTRLTIVCRGVETSHEDIPHRESCPDIPQLISTTVGAFALYDVIISMRKVKQND